ncbi:MAG: hypothetical protein Q8O67_16930 [Deltaproteobacteria bacterium]|nr:hypothetical protein [Deltaproteobacteria bacterium]
MSSSRVAVVVVVVVVVSFFGAFAVFAGPSGTAGADIGAALVRAQGALAKREWTTVIAALSEGLQKARDEAPLVVSRAVVVDGPHVGLGVYTPVKGALVRDRRLRLYVEVENLVARALPDGRQELSLDVTGHFSTVALDGTRESLGRKSLGTQQVQTFRATGVHSFGVDVALGPDAPAGGYVVDVEVADRIGGKSARASVAFTL